MFLWRDVDDEGEVLDLVVQRRRDTEAALKLLKRLLRSRPVEPEKVLIDGLASYPAALDRLGLRHPHSHGRLRENNRAENSHQPSADEIDSSSSSNRDPFEPILPILEAQSPVGEYRKIADEVLLRMPNERRYPRAAAETVRSFLMVRLGLHLGLRQKNLRELLIADRDQIPRTERELEALKRGELRWSAREAGWEVFIPCAAFKNADSAYFSKRPYRLVLPDLGGLYAMIDRYLARDRPALLAGASDPGTFFIKTVKVSSRNAAFTQSGFYEAWRLIIQRHGIYNPWTGRGAIEGLMSHGPHSVRDVLATHVLKQTGSYEQASYAIQDTPATVAAHYGRFLPQDKAALAAKVLNQVWES